MADKRRKGESREGEGVFFVEVWALLCVLFTTLESTFITKKQNQTHVFNLVSPFARG